MQQMEVNPPAAAAREPLSMVSACSKPGSRRCTCMSMKPGATIMPAGVEHLGARRRTDWAPRRRCARPRSARRPCGRCREAGSITRPFLITMDMAYPITFSSTAMRTAMPFSTWFRITERWKSATSRRELAAAVDGPGMHHDGVRLGQVQVLQAQAVEPEIFAGRKGRFVLPLQLHAQHHDDVGVADGLADIGGEPHAGRELRQFRAAAATPVRTARSPRRISRAGARWSAPRGCARCRR